jgi:tetratricopeptide (TPR) repeat protein
MAGTLQEGIRLFLSKRWAMALEELKTTDTAGFSDEENAELAYYLGLCYTKLGQYEAALLYLEQVVTNGSHPLRAYQCRMALAYIYAQTKRSKMAEFELNRLVSAGFESVQLYTTLAYAAWAQKNYKRAVEFYEKALEIDATNATALNGLGFILVDTGMDINRGLRCCRKAVDKKPQNPAYLDSLGWAYFKTGDYQEARLWLRRAKDLAPRESEIKFHMRMVVGDAK